MIHDQKRVDAIRKHANERIKIITGWEAKVTDQYIKGQLHMVKNWFTDIEQFFLKSLIKEQRSPEQEAYWLNGTETSMRIAELRLVPLLELLDKYGPNVESHG